MVGSVPSFSLRGDESIEELRDEVARMQKQMNHLLRHLSSKNITEVGGWFVNQTELISKDGDVGMNTEDTGADDIRFFAGGVDKETAPFKVRKSGIMEAIGAMIGSALSGMRVTIDDTGLHAFDSSGVERITIGTAPAKGAKALVFRDSTGVERTVLAYDTETVDGASRTGQYITAHGSYILIQDNGEIRIQSGVTATDEGIRIRNLARPEINDGSGWSSIAKKSEADNRGKTLSYNSTTKQLSLVDASGVTLSTVTL